MGQGLLVSLRWTDFSTNLQEFVSIRLHQLPGVIRLDSERYITELVNEVFSGGIHAKYAVPTRPELPSLIDDAVRRRESAAI
eukprot:6214364-Pleurochrysis_carterae.AAC.11